jgi:hypothetical protein
VHVQVRVNGGWGGITAGCAMPPELERRPEALSSTQAERGNTHEFQRARLNQPLREGGGRPARTMKGGQVGAAPGEVGLVVVVPQDEGVWNPSLQERADDLLPPT